MAAAAFHLNQQRRRETLAALQAANDSPPPRGDGLSVEDEILLGSFKNRRLCRRLVAKLADCGIAARSEHSRTHVAVYVRVADRGQAFELLEKVQRGCPNIRPRGTRRDYDWTILCSTLALVPTACMFAGAAQPGFMQGIAYLLTGVCIGVVIDRCQRNLRYYDSYQFTMREALIFTGMAASLLTLWSNVIRQ